MTDTIKFRDGTTFEWIEKPDWIPNRDLAAMPVEGEPVISDVAGEPEGVQTVAATTVHVFPETRTYHVQLRFKDIGGEYEGSLYKDARTLEEVFGVFVSDGNDLWVVPAISNHSSDVPELDASRQPMKIAAMDRMARHQVAPGEQGLRDFLRELREEGPSEGDMMVARNLDGSLNLHSVAWHAGADRRLSRLAQVAVRRASGKPATPLFSPTYGTLIAWGEDTWFTPLVEDERGVRITGDDFPVRISETAAKKLDAVDGQSLPWHIHNRGEGIVAGFFALRPTYDGELMIADVRDSWPANKDEVEVSVRNHMGWEDKDFVSVNPPMNLNSEVHLIMIRGDDEADSAMRALHPPCLEDGRDDTPEAPTP